MQVEAGPLAGIKIFTPAVFADERGYFLETYNQERYTPAVPTVFVQDNESHSKQGVLRGLHLQTAPHAQGKLVRVVAGEVLDVVVDVRPESDTFGQYFSQVLSDENKIQIWIPPGFAHGFVTRSETATFAYKCTAYYEPTAEVTLAWNDPTVAIDWEVAAPILTARDQAGLSLAEVRSVVS